MVKKRDGNFGNDKSFHSFAPPIMITDTKERIRIEAGQLLIQFGIRSMSMDDIASRLGMSKKTIYQYFKDKDELVLDIVNKNLEDSEYVCEKDILQADNAIHEVILAMDKMQRMYGNMNPGIIFDLQKYHPKAFSRFRKHKDGYMINMIRTNLQKGIAEGLYRPEINIDILARYRVESIFIVFNPGFQQATQSGLVQGMHEILINFLFGLVTPKGHKMIETYLKKTKFFKD